MKPRKSTAFSVNSNLTGGPAWPDPLAALRRVVERLLLGQAQVAFANHALDDLLQELVQRGLVSHQPLQVLVGEQPAPHQRLQHGIVQRLEVVLVPLARLVAEAALQQEVARR